MLSAWLRQLRHHWSAAGPDDGRRLARKRRRPRLQIEPLEERLAPAQLSVISPLDPATLTAGTLRYAVQQANADAAQGGSDTITFNTSQMGTNTVTLQQGQ